MLWCLSPRRGRPCATKSQTSTAYTQALGPDRCWKFTMCDVSETETWTVFPLKGAVVPRKKVISCYSCSCAHTQEVPGKSDCTEPGSIGAVTTTKLRKKRPVPPSYKVCHQGWGNIPWQWFREFCKLILWSWNVLSYLFFGCCLIVAYIRLFCFPSIVTAEYKVLQ